MQSIGTYQILGLLLYLSIFIGRSYQFGSFCTTIQVT